MQLKSDCPLVGETGAAHRPLPGRTEAKVPAVGDPELLALAVEVTERRQCVGWIGVAP